MPLQDVVLYGVSGVLFLAAVAVSFFLLSEGIALVRDIARNRGVATSKIDSEPVPQRRIVPFRDRGTIERLIAYFRGSEKK